MKVRIPNSGGPGNMNQMLKQAQKMQEDMATLQADLEAREYTASSGGGSVTVTVDGKHLIKCIENINMIIFSLTLHQNLHIIFGLKI